MSHEDYTCYGQSRIDPGADTVNWVNWGGQILMALKPPLFCAPTALCVAPLSGTRAWLQVQDFEMDAVSDVHQGRLAKGDLDVMGATLHQSERMVRQVYDRRKVRVAKPAK